MRSCCSARVWQESLKEPLLEPAALIILLAYPSPLCSFSRHHHSSLIISTLSLFARLSHTVGISKLLPLILPTSTRVVSASKPLVRRVSHQCCSSQKWGNLLGCFLLFLVLSHSCWTWTRRGNVSQACVKSYRIFLLMSVYRHRIVILNSNILFVLCVCSWVCVSVCMRELLCVCSA